MSWGTAKPPPFDVVVVHSFSRHCRGRAAGNQGQEEAGDRPLACRHDSADLSADPGRGRRIRPAGREEGRVLSNARRIFTRDGGRWGIAQVYRILTAPIYVGRHQYNKRDKSRKLNAAAELITVEVPPIVDQATFDVVQAHLRSRNPRVTPARVVSGPTLLTGICFCADCGGAMTVIRRGKLTP